MGNIFNCKYKTFIGFKSLLLSIIFFAGLIIPAMGQSRSKNAIYLEGATRGPAYSVNYDRIFRQGQKLAYSFRAGFSVYNNNVAFPVGISLITGLNDHHAEFSLSIIPFIDYKAHLVGSNNDQSDKYIFVNPAIGYRYQKRETGIFLKVAAGPSIFLDPPSNDFWNMDPKLHAFASFAAGISF